jgi:hypothetical protein
VQLCLIALIVCDCMVYPDPKFLIYKTENGLIYFLKMEADFFYHSMLSRSRKAFAINLLKYTFVCVMYGLTAKSSIARLNICQILMRFTHFVLASVSVV